jgi:hypothetical protein
MQSGWRERAGSREQRVQNSNYKSTDSDMELDGGVHGEERQGGEDNEESGREDVGIEGGVTAGAGLRPCAGMSDEASTAASRGRRSRFLHGRGVARFGDPLRGGEHRSRRAPASALATL